MKIIMKIMVTAILTIAPVLLAQEPPDTAGPPVRIMTNGALGSSNVAFISSEMVGGSPVTGAPYSAQAITETTQTLADGNRIVNNTSSMLYRDSQGRERRELPFPKIGASTAAGQPAQMVMISDPVAGVRYTLDANSRTAHKMPAPPSTQAMAAGHAITTRGGGGGGMAVAAGLLPPPPGAPDTIFYRASGAAAVNLPKPTVEQLGTTTIEGVQAEGTRTTTTIPAGQIGNDRDLNIISERWYSPELKMTVLSKHSDPRMGETTYRLTQINRSEPAASLFQVPADYTITDPAAAGNAVWFQKPPQ